MRTTFQNRHFWNQAKVIAAGLIGLAPAMMIASPAAANDRMTAGGHVVGLSGVFESVRELPDYGAFVSVHYDRPAKVYRFRYTANDGTQKRIAIDALTGRKTRAVAAEENPAFSKFAARAANDPAPVPAGRQPIGCLTYLSQFESAISYYAGESKLAEAESLADKGRKMCNAGNEPMARAYLMVALGEIGVTPAGVAAPPRVTVGQQAKRPGPRSNPGPD